MIVVYHAQTERDRSVVVDQSNKKQKRRTRCLSHTKLLDYKGLLKFSSIVQYNSEFMQASHFHIVLPYRHRLYTGVVAGNLVAVPTKSGPEALDRRLGRLSASSTAESLTFVIPMTGGSPFLTNSYSPGNLFPAKRIASRTTASWTSPFNSNIILLTATRDAQWSKEPFPFPMRWSLPDVYTPMLAHTRW